MLRRAAIVLAAMLMHAPAFAQTALRDLPPLLRAISDEVGVMSIDEARALSRRIAHIEDRDGAKIIIVIPETTQPEEIEDYTGRLIRAWNESTSSLANGKYFFLVIAVKDRTLWIEPGPRYADEMRRMNEDSIIAARPYLKMGNYYEAISVIVGKLEKVVRP